MPGFDQYLRCFRCGTSRPKSKLLASVCSDGFCVRVLEIGLEVVASPVEGQENSPPSSVSAQAPTECPATALVGSVAR